MTLHSLMEKYGSDKASHGFAAFYESFFAPVREDVKSLLEVGVYRGASMLAFRDYFPNAAVAGVDDGRMQRNWPFTMPVYITDQGSRVGLADLLNHTGPFDIVLDDGGHTMWQQQVSLAMLLPATRRFYVVEDLHTSFYPIIGYTVPGEARYVYATGADFPLTATFDVLDQWPDLKSDYMTQEEWDYLVENVANVDIFDRDSDHKHMTAVLEVRDRAEA